MVVDYFIKWIEVFVLFNIEVKIVVVKIVEEFIVRFGVLEVMYLD